MKINQLTFFRFVAAMLIVVFHFGRDVWPFSLPLINPNIELFNSSVSFFFVLSGFLLTLSNWDSPRISKRVFYLNRFLRIYPLYVLAFVIFLYPVLIDGNFLKYVPIKQLIVHLTLTQSVFFENAVLLNYPAWSLSVEACFYLVFPLIFNLMVRRSAKLIIVFCFIFWFATLLTQVLVIKSGINAPAEFYLYSPIFHLSTFVMGMGTGVIYCRYKNVLNLKKNELILVTLLLIVTFSVLTPLIKHRHNGFYNPFFVSLILLFSLESAPFKRLLSSWPLVALGDSSYGIYILQVPIWRVFNVCKGYFNQPLLQNFWLYTGGLIIFSIVCFFGLERPIMKKFKAAFAIRKRNIMVD